MRVRTRTYASGQVAYQADLGKVDGKRVQIACETKKEAERRVAEAKKARARHGERAFALTPVEMSDVILAREKLAGVGATLNEAVDYYLKHASLVKEAVLLPELVTRFIRSRELAECSDRYVKQLKVSLKSLGRAFSLTSAAELRRDDVKTWLRSSQWAAKTRNNYLGDVGAMFGWAIQEGLAAHSPCVGIAKVALSEEEIHTLEHTAVRALLDEALALGDAELLWYLVLATFCGLRPAEITRLRTAMISLKEKTVIVVGSSAKTGMRRVVDLTDNAVAWLEALPLSIDAEKICGKGFTDRWRCLRRRCGWAVGEDALYGHVTGFKAARAFPVTRGPWLHDVLRHTFASMHYAEHQNEALLKAQMGHWERADTLHRHYRALKTRDEAARFWALRPALKVA